MKLKLLLSLLLLISFTVSSQTLSERKAIISNYDLNKIEELKNELISLNAKREVEINNYLFLNPSKKRKFTDADGRTFEIKNIIDGKPIYITTDAINSLKATRTNYLNTGGGLGLSLDGQNMHVGVWDIGHALTTHQELLYDSPIPITRVTIGDAASTFDDHATHVSGIIIARGVNAGAIGMATEATLTSYTASGDASEATSAAGNGLLISNHSYGVYVSSGPPSWYMGCYSSESRIWDQIAYAAPYYLQVTSAGNAGTDEYTGGLAPSYDKLTEFKTSKNNLVVANGNNPIITGSGELSPLSLFINSSSSQGPTDDGRVKPDITGDGTGVISCVGPGNTDYDSYNGTSMAAPNVAGSLLLLQQYNNQLNGSYMKASTLKGLVCHTADDDHILTGPDAFFGWGLLNAKAAAETLLDETQNQAVITESTLDATNNTFTYTFSSDGSSPIRASICWTDPAGTDHDEILNDPTPALVNDLDLRIEDPSSTVHLPWKLQLDNITGGATTGDNLVDNIERIDIAFPIAGTYTLTVSHKGTVLTNASQDFSLIITSSNLTLGVEEQNSPLDFVLWPNPADNELNFKYNSINDSYSKISLVDVQGRVVYADVINPSGQIVTSKINTSNFSNGIYFLNIEQGNAKLHKKVMIK